MEGKEFKLNDVLKRDPNILLVSESSLWALIQVLDWENPNTIFKFLKADEAHGPHL